VYFLNLLLASVNVDGILLKPIVNATNVIDIETASASANLRYFFISHVVYFLSTTALWPSLSCGFKQKFAPVSLAETGRRVA
jgi:hypothetical protein